MLPKINIYDYKKHFDSNRLINNKLVNIRGTNGSGKSTIPFSFLKDDKSAFELVYYIDNKERVAATVFPNFGWLALGSYRTKCGGLDSYKTTEQTVDSLELVWDLNFNIIMEGILSSTVFSTYSNLFLSANSKHSNKRDILVCSLLPPFEVCTNRISVRNGGKSVKTEQVRQKYDVVFKNVSKFKEAGVMSISLDNSDVPIDNTREWFLHSIEPYFKNDKEGKINNMSTDRDLTKKSGLFIEPEEVCKNYEWFKYYKEPDESVKIDLFSFKQFWYWIHERQEIWNKRVNKGLPAPWTDDKILQQYKFTHACRNLDKLSIYYIKNILSRLQDTEESKKEIILNTMIYRLFCRLDTWEMFGFLELSKWDSQWKNAQKKLREKRANGKPVFTDAYYVCGLKQVNPDPITNLNKTENAICLINYWYDHLDEIYENVALSDSMYDALEYLKTLPCIGCFNAYEFVCDFAWCHTYTNVNLVNWTIDSYTNVGPGASKGLKYIFTDRGNLSELECIIYLRSVAKHYLKEYGYSDLKLPQEIEELDLRCIEHSLCEYQKYRKAYDGTGRPRVKFTQKTYDNDLLKI